MTKIYRKVQVWVFLFTLSWIHELLVDQNNDWIGKIKSSKHLKLKERKRSYISLNLNYFNRPSQITGIKNTLLTNFFQSVNYTRCSAVISANQLYSPFFHGKETKNKKSNIVSRDKIEHKHLLENEYWLYKPRSWYSRKTNCCDILVCFNKA